MTRYLFGGFCLDTDIVEVAGPDGPRKFEPQVFDVLLYLVEQQGRLVTKEELLDNVWGDRFISESAMTTRIKQARRLVDDDGRTQWAIKTVHGRGYRFVAPVEEKVEEAEPSGRADANGTASDGSGREPSDRSVGSGTKPSPGPGRSLPGELKADARRLFVGRDEEISAAEALVDRTVEDPVRWIWLLGEPGIGKTRTAAEVAQRANARGHRVLFGRNNEDLTVPYQPIIEAMRSAVLDLDGPDMLAELGPRVTDLLPLLPELGPVLPEQPPATASPLDDNSRRYQLMEAIAEWLSASSAAVPTILVIDDVHWAADSTLQFLGHLQQRQQQCDLTVVATARNTAPDENPKVIDLIAGLSGSDRVLNLELAGLDDRAAARLVGGAGLEQAMQQTAGNPLLLQALNPEDQSIDLNHAVRRRLASLPDGIQQLLSLAAVVGLEFDLKVVAAALERPELDVLDDVERAMAARLLIDVGVDRFRFVHALVRSSLLADVSSGRRTRWHAAVAEAIHRVFPQDPSRLPEVAYHTAEAAVADPALRFEAVNRLRQAAALAVEQLSFGEAAELLDRARTLAPADDRRLQAELALAQGDAESRLGASALAMRTYDAAITDARQSGDAELLALAAILFASVSWRPGTADNATLDRTTEALAVLDAVAADGVVVDSAPRLRAQLHIGKVRAHAVIGEFDLTDAAYRLAWQLIEPMGDEGLEGELLAAYLSDLRPDGNQDETIRLWHRLAEIQDSIEDRETKLLALQIQLHYDLYTGRFGEFRQVQERLQTEADSTRSTFWGHISSNNAAMLAFNDGDLARTEELAERCLELARQLPEEDGSGTYGLRMFTLRREQDRLAQLGPLVRHLVSTNPAEAFWTPGLALLSAETGHLNEAGAIMEDFKSQGFAIPRDAMWSTVMALLAETAVATGDAEACRAIYRRLEPLAGHTVVTGHGILCLGAIDRYLGLLCHAVGDLDQARLHLEDGLAIDAKAESVLWANHSRLWLARTRRAQGQETEARALADVVLREATDAGLPRLVRLAEAERQA